MNGRREVARDAAAEVTRFLPEHIVEAFNAKGFDRIPDSKKPRVCGAFFRLVAGARNHRNLLVDVLAML